MYKNSGPTNYQSGWSVQEIEIDIAVNGQNIKKAESIKQSIINHSIKQYQAIEPTAIWFLAQIRLRTQTLQMF